MPFSTCDLYDVHEDTARVVPIQWLDFGGRAVFSGTAVTARCFEDNSVVKKLAAQPGAGKVMVIDGGGSLQCALIGDMIAQNAVDNRWEGIIIVGAVRDRAALSTMNIGIKALGTTPRKSVRRDVGDIGVAVELAGVTIKSGEQIYADDDGVLVLPADFEVE